MLHFDFVLICIFEDQIINSMNQFLLIKVKILIK